MKRGKEPTWTKLVLDALRSCDDFMNRFMLEKETGGSRRQPEAGEVSLPLVAHLPRN